MTQSQLLYYPIDQLGTYLYRAYTDFKGQEALQYADIADRYYERENDIMHSRILFMNDNDDVVEDTTATNTKISHGFFPELVDQKTQFITSNSIAFKPVNEEDTALEDLLKTYFDDDFQLAVQECVEAASIHGFESLFARTTADDRLRFQVADALNLLPVYNEYGELVRVCRYYPETRYDVEQQKTINVQHCDVWGAEGVAYYVQDNEGRSDTYKLDDSREINPSPHVVGLVEQADNDGTDEDENDSYLPLGRNYEHFPFYVLYNNKQGSSDLKPIKDIIDDYDLMNCFMSNNLQDFTEAFYVVKGARGESLDRVKQNIKSRKAVLMPPDQDAGVDVKTYNIPFEGRVKKMELDEKNIYRSGMGFNSNDTGDGNITNVVIKSRYTLLTMKANKLIVRLNAMLKWCCDQVAADINRRTGGGYTGSDIAFEIEPSFITNETDIANDKLTTSQAELVEIQSILLVASRIGDDEALQLICEKLELDYQDVKAQLEEAAEDDAPVTVPDSLLQLAGDNEELAALIAEAQAAEEANSKQQQPSVGGTGLPRRGSIVAGLK